MNTLNIISYNMGTNIRDFAWECEYLKQEIDDSESGQQMYKKAQENTAKNLVDKASVYLLQEVEKEDRALIVSLKIAGYAIFHILNNPNAPENTKKRDSFDTAIALKMDVFEKIENHSKIINGYDTAIISTTYKLSEKRIIFVSGHVPGFNLEETKLYKADSLDGDKYCLTIINTLAEIEGTDMQIVGADMNANPEIMTKAGKKNNREWTHRFEEFEDAGFKIHRTKKATNVKPNSNYCKRELDFIFVRTVLHTQHTKESFFKPNTLGNTTRLLKWDSSLNASDHRPILTQLPF
ncbi:MAG: hypothetical protein H0T62_13945 [Parachlamydiaceae bacterium]|nr:hypothetical protein [Parachlamydiaceae bacterium]